MKRWMIYLNERSPLPVLIFLSSGICLSSMAFLKSFHLPIFLIGVIFNTLIFIQMRLGDEVKDFEKDKIQHPTRPLPRGLLSVKEVVTVMLLLLAGLTLCGLLIATQNSWAGGLGLIFSTFFAWLMFKEFYIGEKLNQDPMFYALTHQVIVFPIYAWVGLTQSLTLMDNRLFLGWLLANFGASFTFEICRKLDPNAHKLAQTYAHHYGSKLTAFFVTLFILISAYGCWLTGIHYVTWPVLLILWLGLFSWVKNPQKYKSVEGLSALSSAFILWTPAIIWLWNSWS